MTATTISARTTPSPLQRLNELATTHLMLLYESGQITYEDLITKSQDPGSLIQKLEERAGKKR